MWSTFFSVSRHREIVRQLIRREIAGRYRGSILGVLWSLAHPVAVLSVYTFVFHGVLKAKWDRGSDTTEEFVLLLFTGLIVYSFFADCINRAPNLIVNHAIYVRKVVFPLEVLPWVGLGTGMFHMGVSLVVLLSFYLASHLSMQWTAIWFPVLLAPLSLFILGLSWFLASAGVFVRDVAQAVGVLTNLMLFLSPVLYPMSAVPEAFQTVMYLNPLTFIVEQARDVLIVGRAPAWTWLGLYYLSSIVVAGVGLLWFQKTRKGFADVL